MKSLNLSDIGYSYIEETCLKELATYKENEVELNNYTVLVPKTRAKSYFGTYLNNDYYYDYTSIADMRRNTNGGTKGSLNETKWKNEILESAHVNANHGGIAVFQVSYYHVTEDWGISV